MKQFTWGIIGPGKIANKFAVALTLVEGARLGAVASRDIARAKSFAEAHTIGDASSIRTYDSYQQLAADPVWPWLAEQYLGALDSELLGIAGG